MPRWMWKRYGMTLVSKMGVLLFTLICFTQSKVQVLVALSFYATGSYQRLVGGTQGTMMSQQSVSRAIREVTSALNSNDILNKWLKFPPTRRQRDLIKQRFYEKFKIPAVTGCIDGTHVAIVRPSENEERFYNRKGYHSRNVLIICDADLNILSVDSSFGGASHDTFVWNQHPVKNHLLHLINAGERVFLLGRCWRKKPDLTEDPNDPNIILRGASGALRPGRMTFILGPSGAGKTTLLKILAGRKKTGVTGCLYGAGRSSVLVAQDTTLIDTLTAGETLRFAASLKLPNISYRERSNAINTVTKQLGIHEILNTRAGCLSGGERKRLIIACELLTDPTIMLLDEPTSGLDAVSSLSVARALHTLARSGRTIACVLHQPSSQLYNTADDVILLANGRTLYAGAIADVPSALSRAGFTCPQYYNIADYLLEVASDEHAGDMKLLEKEANSYAHEMSKIAKNDICNGKGIELSPESVALLNPSPNPSKGYSASICQQLNALLWRSCIGVIRDVYLTQIRLICHFVVALLLGALYHGAGAEAGRMMSNTGCLFFFLLFLFFSNAMPTIHTFPVEAKVVLHEHLNKWYSLPAYCASKIIVDLPIQLLCATVFLFPAWYLTSQPLDINRMGLAWLTCALVTILAQTFGFVVGASCGMKLGLFVIPAANIPMLMFSEFFIPYREMPVYLRPFATISYFRYAFDAFLETVYGLGRGKLPCYEMYCMFKDPSRHLEFLGLSRNLSADFFALVIWIVLLQIALVFVLLLRVYKACR